MSRIHYMYLGVICFLLLLIGLLSFLLIQENHRPASIPAVETSTTTVCLPTLENTDTSTADIPTAVPPLSNNSTSSLSWDMLPPNYLYSNSAIDKELETCIDTDYSTYGMSQCSIIAEQQYDLLIQKIYTQLNNNLDINSTVDDEEIKKSAIAEKNYLASTTEQFTLYRQSLCKAAYEEATGGSIRTLLYAGCYLDVTRAHIQNLCSFGVKGSVCAGVIPF